MLDSRNHCSSAPGATQPRILFVGGSGHHYLRDLLREGAEGLLLVDPADGVASRSLAQSLGVEAQTGTLPELASEFSPDVISIGPVYARSGAYVIEALRLGLPCVTDKPLAVTRDQLAEIESLARRPGAPAVVTEFDWRLREDLRAARTAISQGRIGDVVLAVAQKSYRFGERPAWYADRKLYGGTMLWVASHGLDAITFALGCRPDDMPQIVWARGGNVSRPDYGDMEDHVAAGMSLPGGGTGLVHADLLNPAAAASHGKDRLRVVGAAGEILIEEGCCLLTTDDDPVTDITTQGTCGTGLAQTLWKAAAGGEESDGYGTEASLATARLLLDAHEALLFAAPATRADPAAAVTSSEFAQHATRSTSWA